MVNINEVIYFGYELELLEAHIAIHRPFVNRMVIAEAEVTITGYPKPLFAKDNWSRYEKYDVEHIIIPSDLYSPITAPPWGTNFRLQDMVKKKYMHPLMCPNADWVLHGDTDEIIADRSWPKIDVAFGENKWNHAMMHPRLMMTYVNAGYQKDKHSYRWVRAATDFDIVNPKNQPRGRITRDSIGWHFHKCYSSPEEMYWSALNRLEWWDGPKNVPDMDFWTYVFNKRGEIYKEESTPEMDIVKTFVVWDDPELIKKSVSVVTLEGFPKYILENLDKFPYINLMDIKNNHDT